MLSLMGFDSLFVSKVTQLPGLQTEGELQFLWETQQSEAKDIFVQVNQNGMMGPNPDKYAWETQFNPLRTIDSSFLCTE